MFRGKLHVLLCALICSCSTYATVLFSDNFNVNSSGTWTVNAAPTANASTQMAQFAFDYSAFGIPAPPTGQSDTLGLRLRANIPIVSGQEVTTRPGGATSGLSVSPTGQDFGTNYRLSFYAWSNFNGAPNPQGLGDNANSEGGTNNVLFAVGTSGTAPLVVGNTGAVTNANIDGVAFATTGDGGIVNDYRAYPKSGTIAPTSVMAAGSYANTATYYSNLFGSHAAPPVQQTIAFNEYNGDPQNPQTGLTQTGAFGFAWHKVVIWKVDGIITWDIDGNVIATIDANSLVLGGNNIALGQSDVNSTTTRHPSLLFSVFDDVTVDNDVPEPASASSVAMCVAAFGLLKRRRRSAA